MILANSDEIVLVPEKPNMTSWPIFSLSVMPATYCLSFASGGTGVAVGSGVGAGVAVGTGVGASVGAGGTAVNRGAAVATGAAVTRPGR